MAALPSDMLSRYLLAQARNNAWSDHRLLRACGRCPRVTAYAELAWKHRPWGLETALEARHVGSIPVNDRNTDATSAGTVRMRQDGRERGR